MTPLNLAMQLELNEMELMIRGFQECMEPTPPEQILRMFLEADQGNAGSLVNEVQKTRQDKNLDLLTTMVVLEDHESAYNVLKYYFKEGLTEARKEDIKCAFRNSILARSFYHYAIADEELEKSVTRTCNMMCLLLAAGAGPRKYQASWEKTFMQRRFPFKIEQLIRDTAAAREKNPQERYLLPRLETAFDDFRKKLQF